MMKMQDAASSSLAGWHNLTPPWMESFEYYCPSNFLVLVIHLLAVLDGILRWLSPFQFPCPRHSSISYFSTLRLADFFDTRRNLVKVIKKLSLLDWIFNILVFVLRKIKIVSPTITSNYCMCIMKAMTVKNSKKLYSSNNIVKIESDKCQRMTSRR